MDIRAGNTNDIVIENNRFSLVEGSNYVEQKLKFNLQTFLGECFSNTTIGTPYFQEILGKKNNLPQIEALIKDEIIKTPGVINLTFFELDYDNNTRKLLVSFSVESEEGIININELEII